MLHGDAPPASVVVEKIMIPKKSTSTLQKKVQIIKGKKVINPGLRWLLLKSIIAEIHRR